jgi:von Willebrand factor type A domain
MRRVGKLLVSIGALGLLAMALVAPPAGAQPQAIASGCSPATDIEAIVDDSGSMSITDASRLRVQAMNLLIDTLSPSTQLGAVEFGSALLSQPGADTLFPPEPVGPNASAMSAALKEKINADNGATDYNAAFAQSDADNPGATARIFLTDGGHDIGTYNEAHLVHNVPTYVIGFGGIAAGEDQARLQKIAADTGGKYFPLEDAAQLQSVMNSIGAALTCQTPPRLFTDKLGKGESKVHSVAIGAATKSIQITLTWVSPLDKFKLSGLRLIGKKGRLLAIAPRAQHVAKLKVSRKVSSTFTVVKVSRLHKGRLSFAVKATKIGSGQPKVSLTTQVGQSSHR